MLVEELRLMLTDLNKDLNQNDSAFNALGARVEALAQKVSSGSIGSICEDSQTAATEVVQALGARVEALAQKEPVSQPEPGLAATDDVQDLGARVEALAQKEPACQPEPGFFKKISRAGQNFFKSL